MFQQGENVMISSSSASNGRKEPRNKRDRPKTAGPGGSCGRSSKSNISSNENQLGVIQPQESPNVSDERRHRHSANRRNRSASARKRNA